MPNNSVIDAATALLGVLIFIGMLSWALLLAIVTLGHSGPKNYWHRNQDQPPRR